MATVSCSVCNQNHPAGGCGVTVLLEDPPLTRFELSPVSWGLVSTPELKSVSIAINQELSLFVCLECNVALHSKNVQSHISKIHRKPGDPLIPQATITAIQQIAVTAHLDKKYPDWASEVPSEPTARTEMAGIALRTDLYGCPGCGQTGISSAVRKHFSKLCHGKHYSDADMLSGLCAQVLNPGGTKINIRVTRRTSDAAPPAVPDLLTRAQGFDWKSRHPTGIPNARMISPWLMRTRWMNHVAPYRGKEAHLRKLVADPTEPELDWVHSTVKAYFTKATVLLDATDELVLQKLNSQNPDRDGISNTPMHAHHQDRTLLGYANTLSHLLASLLRRSPDYMFPMSPSLEAPVTALRRSRKGDEQQRQESLHSLWMALWHARWPASAAATLPDPTMAFLMLFSLKEGGDFCEARDVTRPIRQLCWGIQYATLHEIHRLVDNGVFPSQSEAYDSVRQFVVEKEATTFNSLRSLQHYATTLAYQSMSLPLIWWTNREDWSEMLYRGNLITLDKLGQIFDLLEAKIIEVWETKVLLNLKLHVTYGDLADDLTSSEPGYSFIDDPNNPFAALRSKLLEGILADPELRAQFIVKDGDGVEQLSLRRCRDWMLALAELDGLLMLAIEMMSGAPARGSELAAMLAKNSLSRLRNLRGMGKFVALIRQYDKTTNNAQADRLIPHALSAVCSDILVQVHTFARPLATYIADTLFPGKVTQYAEMMFMNYGKEYTSDDLSALMVRWTSEILGWTMTISDWRHINIAWRSKLCIAATDLIGEEAISAINTFQAGHSRSVEYNVYGLSPESLLGTPEHALQSCLIVSTDWQKATGLVPGGLNLPYTCATRCHFNALIAAGTFTLGKAKGGAGGEAPCVPVDGALLQRFDAFHRQSVQADAITHAALRETAQTVQRLEEEIRALRKDVRGGVRGGGEQGEALPLADVPVDDEWARDRRATPPWSAPTQLGSPDVADFDHPGGDGETADIRAFEDPPLRRRRGAGAAAATPVSNASPSPHNTFSPATGSTSPQPASVAAPGRRLDVLSKLRQLYGDNATWSNPIQRNAVLRLLQLKEDLVLLMPTGSGKSLVAILPAMIEQGYTVIVLPSLALIEDWERRLTALSVPFERYRGAKQRTPELKGLHNIILVTSDVAKGERFRTAIHALHTRAQGRPVLRYIFDEVQTYFLDDNFRKSLCNPYELRQFPCQTALFSATIPKAALDFLFEVFCLSERTVRFAGSSARPNLLLTITERCDSRGGQLATAKKIISHRKNKNWTVKDRYLVFVSSHSDGLKAAKVLNLPFYHADSEKHPIRDEDRAGIYEGWLRANPKDGMITTSAISSGTDYKHVRFTIHIGLPFGLVLLEQQRGRAGRDGERAYNYMIPHTNPREEPPVDAEWGDLRGIKAMHDMVYYRSQLKYPAVCLTYATTSFVDGKGVTCFEVGGLFVCKPCQDAGIDSVKEIKPPQFEASLPWEAERQPKSLKRNLESAFGHCYDKARKKCATALAEKHANLSAFRRFFVLAGTTCGFCLVRYGLPTSHDCLKCPEMNRTQQYEIANLKKKIKYRRADKPNPCYKCHICSLGGDTLHPPFVTRGGDGDPCPHPHLVLGLAYAIFTNKDLKMRARKDLQPKMAWDDVSQLAAWISTPVRKGDWNVMALLRWASEKLLPT